MYSAAQYLSESSSEKHLKKILWLSYTANFNRENVDLMEIWNREPSGTPVRRSTSSAVDLLQGTVCSFNPIEVPWNILETI